MRLKVDVIVVTRSGRSALLRMPPRLSPLSWLWIAIRLDVVSSPAWRDPEATLRDCPTLAPELTENDWNF